MMVDAARRAARSRRICIWQGLARCESVLFCAVLRRRRGCVGGRCQGRVRGWLLNWVAGREKSGRAQETEELLVNVAAGRVRCEASVFGRRQISAWAFCGAPCLPPL
jgi:hypothetical protein